MYPFKDKSVWQNMDIDQIFSESNNSNMTAEKDTVERSRKRQCSLSTKHDNEYNHRNTKKTKTSEFTGQVENQQNYHNHSISSRRNQSMNDSSNLSSLANERLKPYPSEIKVVLEDDKRLSDVSKESKFDKLVTACESLAPEFDDAAVSCKSQKSTNIHGYSLNSQTNQVGEFESINTRVESKSINNTGQSVSLNDKKSSSHSSEKWGEVLDITVVPRDRKILSDYNYILTQNVEFFEVQTNYSVADTAVGISIEGLPTSKVGLRCIHCSGSSRDTTASSFFPSSTGSIASGLGTIGARHFLQGKCPLLDDETLQSLRSTKKISQQQTRTQGKIGLDAYCKDLSKRSHVVNHKAGGIVFCKKAAAKEASNKPPDLMDDTKPILTITTIDKVRVDDANEIEIDRNDPSAFVAGSIEHFWECKHCNMLPFPWRASGSVVFSADTPTIEQVSRHLSICQGKKPLRIPRNATMETSTDESKGIVVQVRWKKSSSLGKKSSRSKQQRSSLKDKNSIQQVKTGVEDTLLAFDEDKPLTTEFAHYTVLQLKKCYLTKSGGSRSNCPVGYPGLACSYCAGTNNERRFFYTSADHLRNSFSHIPAHLAICKQCPDDVKQQIGDFKDLRSKQKSLLSNGSHKEFIDRVWGRLHGPGGGVIDIDAMKSASNEDSDTSDDDSCMSSVSVDSKCDKKEYTLQSLDGRWIENSDIGIESSPSEIVSVSDRRLTTDYIFFAMMQMSPLIPNELESKGGNDEPKEVVSEMVRECQLGIVCKHCSKEAPFTLVPGSADELRNQFSNATDHLIACPKCPKDVKDKLQRFKALRATQEALLKYGMHKKFTDLVWSRLILLAKNGTLSSSTGSSLVNNSRSILSEDDRGLVTDFTYYTMEQMKPCTLQRTGNGARSMFSHGFPGLACIHCEGTPSARTFFYRTKEILAGNYAHIPNHILACKSCPSHVKEILSKKKKDHSQQKSRLNRGSQRQFFNNLWARLHLARS